MKAGVVATGDADGFTITGGPHQNVAVDTYEDHRMAMAFALLGLVDTPITINDPGCTAKTFPGYWDLLEELRETAHVVPTCSQSMVPRAVERAQSRNVCQKRSVFPTSTQEPCTGRSPSLCCGAV